jgi:hypothetical protein
MAIVLSKIPHKILVDMRDKFDAPLEEQELAAGLCSKDVEISLLSPSEFFDQWCDYEGLVHYGSRLRKLWQILQEAEPKRLRRPSR